jgi:hypothetical protein
MAIFLHRAFNPAGNDFKYWKAEELDLGGVYYAGPPAFDTLESPVLIRRYATPLGLKYEAPDLQLRTLIEYEEVS